MAVKVEQHLLGGAGGDLVHRRAGQTCLGSQHRGVGVRFGGGAAGVPVQVHRYDADNRKRDNREHRDAGTDAPTAPATPVRAEAIAERPARTG
ncbi:MAG: hypothetical protein DLM61_24210 [Pseudonocardiales bacterium]|nr:MAG: hypothetical protein DLM61_24210 [Pseudonocardiales bacterium]